MLKWFAENPNIAGVVGQLLFFLALSSILYYRNYYLCRHLLPAPRQYTEKEQITRARRFWEVTCIVALFLLVTNAIAIFTLLFWYGPALRTSSVLNGVRVCMLLSIAVAAIAGLRRSAFQRKEWLYIKHYEG